MNHGWGLLALLILMPAPLSAQDAAEPMPERIINLTVYGDDACPEPENADEIVVCGRRPESDRYRIPKDLRSKPEESGAQSWTTQMEALNEDMRYTRPNSCSVVGSYGQTGCFQEFIRQWQAERRSRR